ncbi:MAG: S46 family peptidase [Planctomycetota bacterium]
MTKPRAASPRLPAVACTVAPLFLALLAASPLQAQARKELGRMWTFEHAPLGWFQQAYDWQPTSEWLDHARMSSLRFGSKADDGTIRYFCSASFVSGHGLVMTNHHCARDAISKVQGANDWLKDGFYAGAWENEIKLPGFLMTQLVRQQDVTKEVNGSSVEAVQKEAEAKDPSHSHQVIALYQGGNYQLYSFQVFDDIRLVCAPHGQSAHFGGDPDNFCYPRWGLDFTFLRAWSNDKPLDSAKHHFRWKTAGAAEGDLVFVTGNPGRTGRLQTMAQCEFLRDHSFPRRLDGVRKQIADLGEQAKASAEAEKKLRAQILGLENTRKAFEGYLDGLKNPRVMAIKQKAESDLRAAVAKDPALQAKYGDAWDKIAELQQAKVEALGNAEKSAPLAKEEAAQNKRIGEACFAVYGTSIPPDATMSLRLSDGLVKGYAMNGTLAPYFTTLYGLFARHHEFGGAHPFDLPAVWLEKEKELNLKTPFNFVATCDIIGGNSGSPMIDKNLEVVGLIFDGNIEMLGNNYVFDDEVSRTVSVHPAIIIESLRKIYSAGALADELEQRSGGAPARGTSEAGGRKAKASAEELLHVARNDVVNYANAVRMYRAETGKLPASLQVLADKDGRGRSYIEKVESDPWGSAYALLVEADRNDWAVVSGGPDGTIGTADDVSSRKAKAKAAGDK